MPGANRVLKTRAVLDGNESLNSYRGLDDFAHQLQRSLMAAVKAKAQTAQVNGSTRAHTNGVVKHANGSSRPTKRAEDDPVGRLLSLSRQLLSN